MVTKKTQQEPAGTFHVTYSAEDGARSVKSFATLEQASHYAGETLYRLTGDDYAGFPVALDTYTHTDDSGVNHSVTVWTDEERQQQEPVTDLRRARKGQSVTTSDGRVWTKNSDSEKGAARWTSDDGRWLTSAQMASALDDVHSIRGLAPREEQTQEHAETTQADAQSAQDEWDAQTQQDDEKSAQKSAQGFVCTFAECVHHSK